MKALFVVDRPENWPFEIPGCEAVAARRYLTDPAFAGGIDAQVVNLCRCDRYQGRGYYVSLLAEARGHRPLPDVKAIEDLQGEGSQRAIPPGLQELLRSSIQHEGSDRFELHAYFGRDPAGAHTPLAQQLFAHARAPLLRVHLQRGAEGWQVERIAAMGLAEVPPQHRAALLDSATAFVTGRTPARDGQAEEVPALAILVDPQEVDRPSNEEALQKFIGAAGKVGLRAEIIGPGDIERLAEFDGLFIRTSTNVGHFTWEFARRAEAMGLVVVDDPDSILKCTNKVFLGELMQRHHIPVPRTMMVHSGNVDQVVPTLGLPCILKEPDGGFGKGVAKIESEEALHAQATQLFAHSELLVAQEWLPTEFDWRIGVFDRRPLFAAKYFMASGHWQIIKREDGGQSEGDTQAFAIGEVPEVVVDTAVRACKLIGSGLYGVDLKQVGEQCYLIEVNDNPNVDAGNEDQILGDALYREVMGVFARRIAGKRKVRVQ